MSNLMLRAAVRGTSQISRRAICTSGVKNNEVALTREEQDRIYPRVGDRDIVGFGMHGMPEYIDRVDFPYPAVRFGANTAEVKALRKMEEGDWNAISLADKKALYRASFCSTFAEIESEFKGEWKAITAIILLGCSVTFWLIIWQRLYVYPPLPSTLTDEWQLAQKERMIAYKVGPIDGMIAKSK